jgi:WhiB family redox-sensing transcriptional regulator
MDATGPLPRDVAGPIFPSDSTGVEIAQRICAECPVTQECLDYALANRVDNGIWGGASERRRRLILRRKTTVAH